MQHLKTGATEVADVPCPAVQSGQVLVRTSRSLISSGTERMLVDFGKAGYLAKARQQPDKVREVLDKIRTDGLMPTVEAVRNKLDQPLPLGYCNVGRVLETGEGVTGMEVGDRVVSNGKHAEVVSVPVNLCARIPENVTDDEAAFTILAAIGLQGIRLVQPTLGESVAVTGLGLIGLVTVQVLRANGCRVLGIDFDPQRLALARQFGAEVVDLSVGQDPVAAAYVFSRGRGLDAVIITASTRSSEPVHEAALMCRKRGRIVLVGVTGLELSRADFYEKELTFQVSCSYGPGRYDPRYEQQGLDYPVGFVRWTEQRNLEAVLDMMAARQIDTTPLVSHRFGIADADRAYDLIGGAEPSLGVLLEYTPEGDAGDVAVRGRTVALGASPTRAATPGVGSTATAFVGAGNYGTLVLIPAFKAAGADLRTIVSAGGVSGLHAGRKFGFATATTDTGSVFRDPGICAVVVATRHDTHAALAVQALEAGKHVFVEKPLALTLAEVDEIERAYRTAHQDGVGPIVMVGFNRRFAPHVKQIKKIIGPVKEEKVFVMTVNAGSLPGEHWLQDPAVGGGRIIGEASHFVDLLRFLAGAPITRYDAVSTGGMAAGEGPAQQATVILQFADGSTGTIHYLTRGHKSFPKERLDVFFAGRILQLDNFRSLHGFGGPPIRNARLWRQDKGQKACAAAFVRAVASGGSSPIPMDELLEVSRVTIRIAESLR